MMNDKFDQLLQHLNPQQPEHIHSQFDDNRLLNLGNSGITPPSFDDDFSSDDSDSINLR